MSCYPLRLRATLPLRLLALAALIGTPLAGTTLRAEEIVIDAVVASVNGKPVTLSDLQQRMPGAQAMTLGEASRSPLARAALDQLILERLILEEAHARKMDVPNEDIERYLDEVAARNGLSREGFAAAMAAEGRDINQYREQVRLEILRGRLASMYVKGNVAVSEAEIDQYLEKHPELSRTGVQLKLEQIAVYVANQDETKARQKIERAARALADGRSFAEVAREFSESPEAEEGGMLGLVAENDLSPLVFDAVFSLKAGEASSIVQSPAGFHIFRVAERITGGESGNTQLREEVRQQLQQQKLDQRLRTYFSNDLQQQYPVEKKI